MRTVFAAVWLLQTQQKLESAKAIRSEFFLVGEEVRPIVSDFLSALQAMAD